MHCRNSSCQRNPLHCIIPPHIQAALVLGSSKARGKVLASLQTDGTFRQMRVGFMEFHRGEFAATRTRNSFAADAGLGPHRRPAAARPFSIRSTPAIHGPKLRGEGDPPTGDVEVNEAYDGLGTTYNLYWNIYKRDSIDNRGLPLEGYVHFGHDYDNAFWDGKRMNFGDGDQVTL